MRNKDTHTFNLKRLEKLTEFLAASGEKLLSVKTSPCGGMTISCVPGTGTANAFKLKTSHSSAAPTSGASPPRKRRGAPLGNQRALKTGYHTAKKRRLRSQVARLIVRVNLSLALLGKGRVKRRRVRRDARDCYPPIKERIAAEKPFAAGGIAHLASDSAIFSPSAFDSAAAAERWAKGSIDG